MKKLYAPEGLAAITIGGQEYRPRADRSCEFADDAVAGAVDHGFTFDPPIPPEPKKDDVVKRGRKPRDEASDTDSTDDA